MNQKIFINEENFATFVCPKCTLSQDTDVTKYKQINKEVRLKIKCTCGHLYSVTLERRKQFRKETDIPGKYSYCDASGTVKSGSLVITNISRAGLKLQSRLMQGLQIGDKLNIEFSIGDQVHTLIKKEVIVRVISKLFIGVEFCSYDVSIPMDKALAFYLF